MTAIWKRDTRGFFLSPIGYVFIGAFLAVMNMYFFAGNVLAANSDLSSVFSNMLVVLMFLIPVLTMRLFSEEFKAKTDQLLFTAPVSVGEIVVGKFCSAMTVLFFALVSTLPWIIIVALFGVPAWPSIIGSYVAMICAASTLIAMGLFVSSLTESQIIAAVLSFALFMAIYVLNILSGSITIPVIKTIVSWLSIFSRFNSFTQGFFSFGDIVYFISYTGVFLFFTTQVVSRRRK